MIKPRLASLAVLVALGVSVAAQQAPDRSHPPEVGPPPALHLPTIQKRQLANGMPVWLVELHEVPVVQVDLVVRRGAANDPTGKPGAASLTAAMLDEGAGSRSSLEVADAVDFLGADLGAASGTDSSVVRLHVPVARLADALAIMADVVLRPTFPNGELERLRRERLTNILQARNDPPTIDALAFNRALYGTMHRYGTPVVGTAASIASMSVDDLRSFYASAYAPSTSTLLVVGDITMDKALPMLESAFGSWRAPAAPAHVASVPTPAEPAVRTVYLVDKPGAAQSQIRIGDIGVPRSTPDYFPLQVLNTLLGGSFSSRLNMNLREKHGYTYGAFSAFDMRLGAGPFIASAGVQTDKTADALKEFFNELSGIHQPIPADELARAKNYIALRYPDGFETTGEISRRLEDAVIYDLPADYFSTYVEKVEGVTAAEVARAAQKYIQPNHFAVVVTGDLKTIEQPIRALNLGPVKVLTVDDVFGPAPKL
jgi:zinc protease